MPGRRGLLAAALFLASCDAPNSTLDIVATGDGSTQPAVGRHSYATGTTVRVTAVPPGGGKFTGWTGAASGTQNPVVVTVDGNKTLTAHFGSTSGAGSSSGGGSTSGSSSGSTSGSSSGGSTSGSSGGSTSGSSNGSTSGGSSGSTSGGSGGSTSGSSSGSTSGGSSGGACTGRVAGTKGTNPLFTDQYTADPAALVDGCTFYITAGHDEAAPGQDAFVMREWFLLSSTDLVHWTRSVAMRLGTFSWANANAWAGQMVKARNGKYYWYVPVQEASTGAMAIGVAVADRPAGPWVDALGKPLVNDAFEMSNMGFGAPAETPYTIDPTVFIDDDGQAYLHYGGFWRMVAARLNPDMTSIDGRMIEATPPDYWESPYLIKRNGRYYEIYASGSNPGPISYATASSPMGPWTRGGRVLDPMPQAEGNAAPTNHAGLAEFNGQWYVVYHVSDGPNGGGTFRREVALDRLTFGADGSIQLVKPTDGVSFDGGGSSSSSGGSASSSGASSGGTSSSGTSSSSGSAPAGFYTWPPYSPNIAYDYADEFGAIPQPTKAAEDCSGVAGSYSNGWWTFRYGSRKNSLVTASAWVPMLERFNKDFSYITDVMRWPRDGRARAGNYSAIYLYGSGLCTDSASNTETGGWQGWAGDGPIVLASYYPVYSFDPACGYGDKVAQQGAMIHEGIHGILATMPGVKKACWFHEGGNTWLQATMEMKRSGKAPTSMGWLSAGAALAPFMPVETYSGWLLDGSFGGPCAERVNQVDGGKQICTWRRLLGGTQYGEAFPHAMEVILGEKSIAWVWRYAQKSGRVLQDLAEVSGGLGPTQTRRLIQEYRGRQAFGDFGVWSAAYKKLLDDNWNAALGAEWSPSSASPPVWNATCYVATTQSGPTLTPEDRTLPGWSGANQIPLTVSSTATSASVTFNPAGANMSCQLVYRDTSGAVRYGTPVSSGPCSIPLSSVKNGVIVAVIANTDYVYDGGTKKYAYTLTLGDGVTGKADISKQWYR